MVPEDEGDAQSNKCKMVEHEIFNVSCIHNSVKERSAVGYADKVNVL